MDEELFRALVLRIMNYHHQGIGDGFAAFKLHGSVPGR
jgi:hypothetical protein